MSWPIIIAVGTYLICKGIQDGIDENRNQGALTSGRSRRGSLPHRGARYCPIDCEYEIIDEGYDYDE